MKIEVTFTIVVRMNEKLWKKVISSEIYIYFVIISPRNKV